MPPRLPSFVIVGAMKSGTTSIAQYIAAHPQGYVPREKELYFFERDDLWRHGPAWYAERFAASGGEIAVGEGSPSYMYWPVAVDRMATVLPEAKLIAILRNPVERAYSHYLQWRFNKLREHRSFDRAVAEELAAGVSGLGASDATGSFDYSYVGRGVYLPQLEHICSRFPRESLLVLLTDDLEARPREMFAGVCRFLGIDDSIVPDDVGEVFNAYHAYRPVWLWRWLLKRRESRRVPKRYELALMARMVVSEPPEDMEPDVRAALVEFFGPHNAALGGFIGRDLSAWTHRAE